MSEKKEFLGYYIAVRAVNGDRETKSGQGRFMAHSEYEAEGMVRAIVRKAYNASGGWVVTVAVVARDSLTLVEDPEEAALLPGRFQ